MYSKKQLWNGRGRCEPRLDQNCLTSDYRCGRALGRWSVVLGSSWWWQRNLLVLGHFISRVAWTCRALSISLSLSLSLSRTDSVFLSSVFLFVLAIHGKDRCDLIIAARAIVLKRGRSGPVEWPPCCPLHCLRARYFIVT